MLPIGDPAVLWRHTVCLNAIIHRLRYTLTVAVCAQVPRKSTAAAMTDYYYHYGDEEDCRNGDVEGFDIDDGQDREYDLQLLSRYVHTVYASTSGRRMDSAKGPRERPVYPALCWAADDYAEAFRTVIVRPGQTVCAELVASWPGPITDEYADDIDGEFDDGKEAYDQEDGAGDYGTGCVNECSLPRHRKLAPAKRKENRAVIFMGAIPYAAVRAAYECKMSLYREAERQQRKLQQQQQKRGGKKSSLGAALSASLTALFTGGKDSAGCSSNSGDYNHYYSAVLDGTTPERVEYVTVRGCHAASEDRVNDCDESLTDDGIQDDFDNDSANSATYDSTKGLAQMAITLAPVQQVETMTPGGDENGGNYPDHQQHQSFGDVGYDERFGGGGDVYGYDDTGDHEHDCDDLTNLTQQYRQQQPQLESSYPTTASEPGDFYDYGWDYETATGSGQQTPQTPSYYYQVQQQQEIERRRRRRGGRPRRLSDPCSTSVLDLLYDGNNGELQQQYYQRQLTTNYFYNMHYGGSNWKWQQNHFKTNQQQYCSRYGTKSVVTTPQTPGRADKSQQPHRAWSESDGLDRCGGGSISGFMQHQPQQKQQRPLPLPPPPVPYYCAAEAAASGFVQSLHKSPGGWWTRKRKQRRIEQNKRKARSSKPHSDQAIAAVNRRRSSSTGGNVNYSYASTTDDDDGGEDDENNGDFGSDGGNSNSDDQESDGEFIGALAAAAAFGHNPDREWTRHDASGNPVADWDQYNSDSDSVLDDTNDVGDMVEWTVEIAATDLRLRPSYKKWSIPMVTSRMMLNDSDLNWYGKQLHIVSTPVDTNYPQKNQSQEKLNHNGCQQPYRRRRPPPQFQPQPIEPPPRPPALSVAFTAVACPWWTVLEDVLLVATSGESSSSTGIPLLTFD